MIKISISNYEILFQEIIIDQGIIFLPKSMASMMSTHAFAV